MSANSSKTSSTTLAIATPAHLEPEGQRELEPTVWRIQWPAGITNKVVSATNPAGTITNSDLEMAGVLLHELVLQTTVGREKMRGAQAAMGCDNSPALSSTNRMGTRSDSPISFRLLRGLAMRQRLNRSAPPAVFHVAGIDNILADVASRPPSRSCIPFALDGKIPMGHVSTHFSHPL
jgi:hypothetical protein